MINIFVSRFIVGDSKTSIYFATQAFASETLEEAEKETAYLVAKEYPSKPIRLLGTFKIDEDLIDRAYESRH